MYCSVGESYQNDMMKLILFFFFIAVLAIGCYAVEKRKDDKWPPKEILETFRPIAKVCQEHTGVTHGRFCNFPHLPIDFFFIFYTILCRIDPRVWFGWNSRWSSSQMLHVLLVQRSKISWWARWSTFGIVASAYW